MSEDYARLREDASSVKDVVDAREGICMLIDYLYNWHLLFANSRLFEQALPIDQEDDEDISSEASTLLSSGVPSSHHNHQHHHKHQRQQYHQNAEDEETSTSRTGVLGTIFSGETILRMGLFAGMVAVVCLAVVRAMDGEFSPGLVAGGGLMMIMCLVVGKRDLWRGRMAIG